MNTNMLKATIVLHGETQKQLAQSIGIGLSAFNDRLNGKMPFRQDEIDAIYRHYSLTPEEMVSIFFASETT